MAKKPPAAQTRKRIRILLKADARESGPGGVDIRIAEAFDLTVATIQNVPKRSVLEGFDAAIERKKQCLTYAPASSRWPEGSPAGGSVLQ